MKVDSNDIPSASIFIATVINNSNSESRCRNIAAAVCNGSENW